MLQFKWQQLCSLATCFLLLLAVAISKDGKILGHKLAEDETTEHAPALVEDDVTVVSTEKIAPDVVGYAGNVPLKIYIRDGKVEKVEALPNAETPDFFADVENNLLPAWNGKTIDEALALHVDAVSGATYSSEAVIESMKRGLTHAKGLQMETGNSPDWAKLLDGKFICTVIVILAAMILPVFVRSHIYRTVQLVLNVAVLGFWSGTFISYTVLVGYLSNGMHLASTLAFVLLLVAAFVLPLFGKKGHYCAWICPLGSLQELAGSCIRRKPRISPTVVRWLDYFRQALWAVLMLLMWAGVYFEWMNYEPFTAFLFKQASGVAIGIAVVFVVLSLFVTRPYCRFVCPTGTLLKISQNSK